MYGIDNSVKLFPDVFINCLIDVAGFKKSQIQMSIYYKYASDGYNIVVLSYIDDCVFWYTYEELGKCLWIHL